jgi:hypothetical protein
MPVLDRSYDDDQEALEHLRAEVERLREAKDRVLEWLRRPQGMGGESIYAQGIAARIEEEFRG